MAGNDPSPAHGQFLAPPAVTALRQEARSVEVKSPLARSYSDDMQGERDDLREAAEQTLNVIVDLDLEGRIKWVSPSWKQVVGTAPASVEGQQISEILVDNQDAFKLAIESLQEDDSRSRFIRFALRMGPDSILQYSPEPRPLEKPETTEVGEKVDVTEQEAPPDQWEGNNVLTMEGQGIMVYERGDGAGHTMWMLRPFSEPREVTIDLPPLLVESLGVGAEVLANYLTTLAEAAAIEPDVSKHPAPQPVLCRICERQITPWWFEKHSDLCLQEHRAEMDVQIAQENLNEQRHAIVKVLDALEARQSRPFLAGEGTNSPPPVQPEYKGLPIGPSPTASAPASVASSGSVSSASSAPGTPPRSRDHSTSGLGHLRGRSFAVRRPLARVVELILDLCDTALEINMPVIKQSRTDNPDDFRTLSPQSESRISQVLQWQSPSSNTLGQEQGLTALCTDTEGVVRAMVDAVIRHRKIVEYAERIRIEYTVLVEECITAALRKAERIAAGQLSDSSSAEDDVPDSSTMSPAAAPSPKPMPEPQPAPPAPAVSALTMSMRNSPDHFPPAQPSEGRSSSVAVSTGSNSPVECPTPRSHKSAAAVLGTSQPNRRGFPPTESDAGDVSDSSVFSSALPGTLRTESPSSDRSLERKRRSLVLPGLSSSPRRQHSPARMSGPHSPLRMPKPRLSCGAESLPSPVVSPSAHASELAHMHYRHHRRQSSATSSDAAKVPPVSPHLTSASQPQPRPAPPSIKDFEIIKPISKGAFGSVYLSKKKSTGEYFAIKVLKKADMVAKNQVTNVKAERAIMMWQGESDFVAKLYWTFSSKDYLYLVMEYLNGGDCASLVKVLGGLPEDMAKKYIAEVVLGVEHLHGRGIVHRDLKPDNFLIDQNGHLKLTDFGLSRMGLVGRQKRVLKSMNEPTPDLLRQGPFPRATSIASSRSASVDLQGSGSPGSTPLMPPDTAGSMPQPSYFSLSQQGGGGLSRQTSRRASGYRSDSGSSDHLHAMFRTMSFNDSNDSRGEAQGLGSLPFPPTPWGHLPEEEGQSEAGESSPQLQPLQPTTSNQASYGTPPQQTMMPPLMALFDPEDHNRRFVGTPDYLAPETINGLGQDEVSDWWSLGCILFEFLFGYPPFNASTPDEVFDNILHRKINWPDEPEELASPEAIDLMNKLMTIRPRDRIGANVDEKFPNGGAEIRSHPWFSDIHWDTLMEDKAQFVPNTENPEDTEYFDARGATLQAFAEELEDGHSPQTPVTAGAVYPPDRPHDALFKVRTQVNATKRPLMPLHIPPHVRDSRNRRLSEPSLVDDFGNFAFKNLPMLEKANKDVIQKLRQEAMQAQQRSVPPPGAQPQQSQPQPQQQQQHHQQHPSLQSSQHSSQDSSQGQGQSQALSQGQGSGSNSGPTSSTSGPSLEGSPLPMPLQRALSQNKGNNRPSSPSSLSQANSSPSRPSQPSSPLLVQFSTGHNHERRKTSGSSSTNSHPSSSGSFQPAGSDPNRMGSLKYNSAASSPIKAGRVSAHSPDKMPSSFQRQGSVPSRARSQTIGSQDGGELSSSSVTKEPYVPGHHKRRSQLFVDVSPSSSDNEDPRTKALLKVQRRRQSSRRLSQINLPDGPFFRPLDVLICEDHPVSRLVMERLFEKLRCRTITAKNGAEAMRFALSEVQFDIIMTEFKLPQVNGSDVARMVRETRGANRHTPIIAVTGYLKDLPETHPFTSLIEKPPTLTKLTEALCKFCQWKPPPKDYNPTQPLAVPTSAARHPPVPTEHSPSSTTSSGFALVPPSSYQGSNRADSVGSSYFGDVESIKPEETPVIVSHRADEWGGKEGGLGISEAPPPNQETTDSPPASMPQLLHAASAPATVNPSGVLTPRKQRSSEAIRAKRESLEKKRYECAESGDDEDEELGHSQVRTPSSRTRSNRPGSKLGIEMMRTNSRGSVVSGSEELLRKERELERRRSGGSTSLSDEDRMGSSPSRSTEIEDRFEGLHIAEDTISLEEDQFSPRHSPMLGLASSPRATARMLLHASSPPLPQPSSPLFRANIAETGDTAEEAKSSIVGNTTPPSTLSEDAHTPRDPITPLVKVSRDDADDDQSLLDAEATPRPSHTPSVDLGSEQTPRPSER